MNRKTNLLSFITLAFLVLILTATNLFPQHPPGSIDGYIKMLESPDRASYQMLDRVIESLCRKEGNAIADIGAGSGYFTVLFSKRAGKNGKVFACDIEKGMIDYIEKRIKNENLKNVVPILCKPDDPMLPQSSVDLIFICDTYHHIGKRGDYLTLLKKYLKPGGRLTIVDYQKHETPYGPPLSMRIDRKEIIKEITGAGYKLDAEFFFLPYQYFIVFKKQ